MPRPLRLLIASTPVGPLGSGLGGGVELTLANLARGLRELGHCIEVVAPQGSVLPGFALHEVPGALQAPMQMSDRAAPIASPRGSVLEAMWDFAAAQQGRFDAVINMAYDALPFERAPSLRIPVAHWVSMGSLSDAMDRLIAGAARARTGAVAVHSRAQADTFGPLGAQLRVLGNGIDLSQYDFCPHHDGVLGFAGRIAPEKGLEDALFIAARAGKPLKVWGLMQDEPYWRRACALHPEAQVSYEGFLPTGAFQRGLGRCQALLMTPRWVEAFGNVAAEALACGVPVVAYARGGPAEITVDGLTGFVVAPDDVEAAAAAVGRLGAIDRAACRRRAEAEYSTTALARRAQAWLRAVVGE